MNESTAPSATGRLTELDLALVNALQLRPRASWSLIGQALGVSPVTAARHWHRLSEAGLAWVTAYGLTSSCVGFLELDCAPGSLWSVADALAEDAHVLSLEHVSDGCDLFLTTAFSDLTMVSRYVGDRLGRLAGITAVRVRLATTVFSEAAHWRLDSLDPAQRLELHDDHPALSETGLEIQGEDRALLIRLGGDGRMDQAELAAATGLSPSSVRRRLDRLVAADAVRFRCDVAAPHTGRPVLMSYQVAVRPDRLDEAGYLLARLPEARLVASVTGAGNLLVSAWLHSVPESRRLEAAIVRRCPDLEIVDRRVSLRTVKRMGRILDTEGRSVRAVPMDVWRDPVPA